MSNAEIRELLAKVGAQPFCFGGDTEMYYWQAGFIEDEGEIFAERTVYRPGEKEERACYYALDSDESAKKTIYESFVIDFVMYFFSDLYHGCVESVFDDFASHDDAELLDLLAIFDKDYSAFLSDVLYWYGIAVETRPTISGGVVEINRKKPLSYDERLTRAVLKRLSKDDPVTFSHNKTFYSWQIIASHGELWYVRSVYDCRGWYDYITDEYGHVPAEDEDGVNALRDAIASCSHLDDWGIIETDSNPDDQLSRVGLTVESLK